MPEYPDITVYIEALERHALGHTLVRLDLHSPFLLRTVHPPVSAIAGARLEKVSRIGKRIVFHFSTGPCLVLHLMIAGRLHWNNKRKPLAAWVFDNGTLTLTEAGTRRQASLHVFPDAAATAAIDPGGLDVFACTPAAFHARLTAVNHTLKRALTDPHILSGIGNAYSDEILHHARLSPVALTQKLTPAEIEALLASIRDRLDFFTATLRAQTGAGFPENVTAFRPEMAAHGKYNQPCPRCATPIQRIVYAANETNYCPVCQTGGKLLADRALSRLLGKDWPKSLEELEVRKNR